jgi:hypothetical protein
MSDGLIDWWLVPPATTLVPVRKEARVLLAVLASSSLGIDSTRL